MNKDKSNPEPARFALWRACVVARAAYFCATAVVFLSSALLPQQAAAVPMFGVSGAVAAIIGGGSNCGSFSALGSTAPVARGVSNACANGDSGSASAQASAGGLGAAADLTHFCCSSAVSSGALAQVATSFIIYGPTPSVAVSLNLVLDSSHSGDYGSRLGINAGSFGFGEVIQFADGTLGQRNGGLLIPGVDCFFCAITSQTVSLPTNVELYFFLGLSVAVESIIPQGAKLYSGGLDAMNTLKFPTSGPVFNLPAGYTASIDGMNVVDNRVVGLANSVPEPGSLALLGISLLGLLGAARRSQNLTA